MTERWPAPGAQVRRVCNATTSLLLRAMVLGRMISGLQDSAISPRKGELCRFRSHPELQVHGSVRRLRSPLYHFSYRNVADHINRVNSLTTISSAEMARHKRKWHWTDAIFRPVARFLRFYIFKKGFLEGFPGLFVAITAAYYVFLKYAKLRELELKREDETTRRPRAPDLSAL